MSRIARCAGCFRLVLVSTYEADWWYSRTVQLNQKSTGATLYLTGGQPLTGRLGWVGIPGRTEVINLGSHQQELPVDQGTQPYPALDTVRVGQTVGIQAQVLFEKREGVFNRESPSTSGPNSLNSFEL